MAAPASASTYKLLRELWPQNKIYELLFSESPLVGLVKKDTSFYEKTRHIGVGYGIPQGIGMRFEDAKQFKSPSKAIEFAITPVSYYGAFSLEGRLMRQAKSNKAIIVDPMKRESKNMFLGMKRRWARDIHGNGGGAIGRILSTSDPTTNTITLDTAADIRCFEPGMALQSGTTDGSSGSVDTGYVTIASIGGTASAPTITIDQSAWNVGLPAITTTSYLFPYGCFGGVWSGLDSWCPNHSGSPGTLFGGNRNLYADRLAGKVISVGGLGMRQAFLRMARVSFDSFGSPDTILTSSRTGASRANERRSATMLSSTTAPAQGVGTFQVGVEYEAIKLVGVNGPLKVIADPDMPDAYSRCLQMDTFTLASTGELLSWIDGSSPDNPRTEDASDAVECRAVSDSQLYCEAPGANVRGNHTVAAA